MNVFLSLNKQVPKGTSLTIGNFDGIHKGHQTILSRLRESSKTTTLITFANHPSNILNPKKAPHAIYTQEHKLKLFKDLNIDYIYNLPFTTDLSKKTPKDFLTLIQQSIPFTHLILGHDAVIGYARQGNSFHIKQISEQLNFIVEYLPPFTINQEQVSSSIIRQLIQQGSLEKASFFLGRPYSIYGTVTIGYGLGKTIGYSTANLDVEGLCLPPLGVYVTEVIVNNNLYPAVSNLGTAPTVRNHSHLLLETHLLDDNQHLYDQQVEVVFKKYLRPEIQFESLSELKEQIARDIEQARQEDLNKEK